MKTDVIKIYDDNTGEYTRKIRTTDLNTNDLSWVDSVATKHRTIKQNNEIIEKETSTGLIPPGLLWISTDKKIILFQRPPALVNIDVKDGSLESYDGAKIFNYSIQLPWTLYMAHYSNDLSLVSANLYALNGRVQNLSDRIYLLPLSNYYNDGHFCLPYLEDEPQKTSINVAEMMNICYNRIWNSEFNDDLTDVSDHYGNTPTIEKERNKILRYYQDHKTYHHTELPVFYEALENFSLEDMLHIIEKEFLVPEWADIEEVQVCHILHFAQSIPGNKTFFDFTSLIYRSLMSGDIV